jgi:hypothetical protein
MAETKNSKTQAAKKTAAKKTTAKKTAAPKKVTKKKTAPKKPPLAAKNEPQDPKMSGTASETPKEKELSQEEKLRKVGDRLSDAADKGVEVLKEVFGKVKDFSVDATELTRLKVEIHRLKGDRDRMFTVMGEKLWELRGSDKVAELKTLFGEDFKKVEELSKDIEAKEKTASKISL